MDVLSVGNDKSATIWSSLPAKGGQRTLPQIWQFVEVQASNSNG